MKASSEGLTESCEWGLVAGRALSSQCWLIGCDMLCCGDLFLCCGLHRLVIRSQGSLISSLLISSVVCLLSFASCLVPFAFCLLRSGSLSLCLSVSLSLSVLSVSRPLCLSVSLSLVLSFSRPLVLSSSRPLVFSLVFSLVLSFSRPLVLSSSRRLSLSFSLSLLLLLALAPFFLKKDLHTCEMFPGPLCGSDGCSQLVEDSETGLPR